MAGTATGFVRRWVIFFCKDLRDMQTGRNAICNCKIFFALDFIMLFTYVVIYSLDFNEM
jgi:hypothetical protein